MRNLFKALCLVPVVMLAGCGAGDFDTKIGSSCNVFDSDGDMMMECSADLFEDADIGTGVGKSDTRYSQDVKTLTVHCPSMIILPEGSWELEEFSSQICLYKELNDLSVRPSRPDL